MSEKFILNANGDPEPCGSLIEWAMWFENADRHIAQDEIGDVRVSTVFLGLDHSFGGETPILFESMVFGGPHDQDQRRYATREEAVKGHAELVAMVRGAAS